MTEVLDIFCPQCGYDMRAIASPRCPECGGDVDRSGLAKTRIPWSLRGETIGRWRAYWRTVWLGAWRIERLAGEMVRPADRRDARRFATITALLAACPFAIGCIVAVIAEGGTGFLTPLNLGAAPGSQSLLPPAADAQVPYVAGMTCWPVLLAAIVLFAWLCTRVPPWFVRSGAKDQPQVRRERAEALSCYTSAALVLALMSAACFLAGLGMTYFQSPQSNGDELLLTLTFGSGTALLLLCFGLWWFNTLRLMRRTVRPSASHLLWTAIGLPATWYVCGIIAFAVFPWVAGLLWLMVESVTI